MHVEECWWFTELRIRLSWGESTAKISLKTINKNVLLEMSSQ